MIVNICETDSVILDHLFTLFDETCDDKINFKEFVYCLSALIRGNLKDKLDFSFKLFDQNKDNNISIKEMKTMLISMNRAISYFGDTSLGEGDIDVIIEGIFLIILILIPIIYSFTKKYSIPRNTQSL